MNYSPHLGLQPRESNTESSPCESPPALPRHGGNLLLGNEGTPFRSPCPRMLSCRVWKNPATQARKSGSPNQELLRPIKGGLYVSIVPLTIQIQGQPSECRPLTV